MECLCMRSRHTALLSNIYTSVYILHQTIQHSTLYTRLELIFRFCTKYIHGTHRILNSDHTGLKTSNIDTSVSIKHQTIQQKLLYYTRNETKVAQPEFVDIIGLMVNEL